MKYINKGWSDSKRKIGRGKAEESGRRNENNRRNGSYNNDNNYSEMGVNKRGQYNTSNNNFYSKEDDMKFPHKRKNPHFSYEETDKRALEMRKNSADFMPSHNYNIDNRNIKYSEMDSKKKKYMNNNNNKIYKLSSYNRDTGHYKNGGEKNSTNKYYNRHGSGKIKNSYDHSYTPSHSFNEQSYGYVSRDKLYRNNRIDRGSRKDSKDFHGGGSNLYKQERTCVENINEINEENHSAEFNELRKNLLKYMDTKEKGHTEDINDTITYSDRDSRKHSIEEQTEEFINSFVNKKKMSYEEEFTDASLINNDSEEENMQNPESIHEYTHYHNRGDTTYGVVNGNDVHEKEYHSYNPHNTDRFSDNLPNFSLSSKKRMKTNSKSLNRNKMYNKTWPISQQNVSDEENSNLIENDNYINEGHVNFGYGYDKYNYLNLKSGNMSADVLHNIENNDLSEEDILNETKKDFSRNNTSWDDDDLFGDADDNNQNDEINDISDINEWNQFNDITLERKDFHNLSSGINTDINAGINTKGHVGLLQNTNNHALRNVQGGEYHSFNDFSAIKESYSGNVEPYDIVKEKGKEENVFCDYNENLFAKTQIEESLKVLNTLQVDIEKVCNYVKHFVDPPEPLFSTMRNVFLEKDVSINSKIAIFYVYNHLIQELRHKYRNNMETYAYISESGLTNFVIPVIKYISEHEKNRDIVSKFYRCISIWSERNIYSKFICDQLIALQTNPNKVVEMNPQNKANLAHSLISNEFSKCVPLQFLLQMPSTNNEHKEASQNEVVHALFENMSKEILQLFENEAIEDAAKITDKVVRMFGQELILLNTEQLELSVLINDNHEEMLKLNDAIKNLDPVK